MMIKLRIGTNENSADIELPAADEYLRSVLLHDLHAASTYINRPNYVEEVDYPTQLSFLAGKQVNLDELNYLAKRLDSFTDDEKSQYFAAVQHEGFRNMKSLINLTFNLDKYTLITDVSSPMAIGKAYTLNTEGAIPTDHSRDAEYDSIGRDIISGKKGDLTEYGLLIVSDKPFEQFYDGKTFPLYDHYGSILFMGIKYNDREEGVSIAEDPGSIITAVNRLGAEKVSDCNVYILEYDPKLEPVMDRLKEVLEKEGLIPLAKVARKIFEGKIDVAKLNAVADFVGVYSSANLIKLADHLDKFEYMDNAIDEDAVGSYFVNEYDDGQTYYVSIEMQEYVDFNAFGEDMMERLRGKFIEGGAVCFSNDYDMDILDELEPEENSQSMGGMNLD